MHLEEASDALVGNTTITKLTDCVDTVYAVYNSLQSYWLFYADKDYTWNFTELKKVQTYILYVNYLYIVCLHCYM